MSRLADVRRGALWRTKYRTPRSSPIWIKIEVNDLFSYLFINGIVHHHHTEPPFWRPWSDIRRGEANIIGELLGHGVSFRAARR